MERFDIVRKQVVGSVELTNGGVHPIAAAFKVIGEALCDSPAFASPDATDSLEFEFEGRTYMAVVGADNNEPEVAMSVDDLKPREREALRLYDEQYSYAEIASRMNITEGRAAAYVQNAQRRLNSH